MPKDIKNTLLTKAQTKYRKAFDSAYESYDGDEPNWRRIPFEHGTSIPKKNLEEYVGTREFYKKYVPLGELYHIASEFGLDINRIFIIQKYGL